MAATNAEILAQLKAVNAKMEEIAQQGRDNGSELKMLRRELGLEPNGYGRLPTIEANINRQDMRTERLESRVDLLEGNRDAEGGKTKFVRGALSVAGGSAGAALIGLFAHFAGFRW